MLWLVDDQAFTGSWVWQLDSLPKIIHFIWLGLHNSIPVKKVIDARGIQCNVASPICQTHEESILHLLRDCPFAREFWRKIGTPQAVGNFLQLDLSEWLKTNCLAKDSISTNGIPWRCLFPFALWSLWKHRNRVAFENVSSDLRLSSSCIHQAREFFFCIGKGQKLKHHRVIPVCWHKPPQG